MTTMAMWTKCDTIREPFVNLLIKWDYYLNDLRLHGYFGQIGDLLQKGCKSKCRSKSALEGKASIRKYMLIHSCIICT